MTTPEQFTQRVYVVIESGFPGSESTMLVMDHEVIPGEKHYRDEHAIADALRNLAERFEQGGSFIGPTGLTAEDLKLARNEPDDAHGERMRRIDEARRRLRKIAGSGR